MSLPKPTVDHSAADRILRQAIAASDNPLPIMAWGEPIKTIIQGKHLTFRYLLMTALLAKATNPEINALALQSGADISGAYDARSLCHKVLVPIERELLNRALGGSNEPFLNKPARFPTISPSNAVRAGSDRELLVTLHQVLSAITTAEQAFAGLCVAVNAAIAQQTVRNQILPQRPESADAHLKILELIEAFVAQSIEGQVAAILTGTVLTLHFAQFTSFAVTVHPANQSGASSREVADIDIKQNGKIFVAVEVKDKPFTDQDLDHAAFKASHYGLTSITFIVGTKGKYIGSSLPQATHKVLAECGVNIVLIDILSFARSIVTLLPNLTLTEFLTQLQQCSHQARVKDAVLEHLANVLRSF
jgi:hypothetical protein